MSTSTANTTRRLVLVGLFCMQIHGGVDAGPPFITPEFAIPEVLDDDEIFLDDNDSPRAKKTRKPFFRKINNWGINNMLKTNPIPPPPPPPRTPPSPVPGTDPLVLDDEEADRANNLVDESFEHSTSIVNEREDVSIDERLQSGASSSSSEEKKKTERYFSFRRSGGRLGFEVQSSTVNGSIKKRSPVRQIHWGSIDTSSISAGKKMTSTKASIAPITTTVADTDAMELSFDASSLCNLAGLIFNGTATTGFAVLGTLRLLAPMLLARRVLLYMLNVASDWYTGRYLRTTYKKMEHQYFRYYQVPAALRSFGRLSILSVFMMTFGRLLEWVVGLRYPPCRIVSGGGCHWWCGLLWITTIVITGRMCGTFLATFMGGPLRLEVCNEAARRKGPRVKPHRFFLTHISNIIHWMLDPDQVIREIVNSASADLKPFHPDGGLFPATWGWLLILQTIACTREMSRNSRIMHSIMRQVLIQQALHDEWYRVLILERRVALGAVLISLYFVATIGVFWTVGTADGLSALLTLPTVCAVMVSTWMNIFFYFERRVTRRRLTADPVSLR